MSRKFHDIADDIACDYQGRRNSPSARAAIMSQLVADAEIPEEIKAVLAVLINSYEEYESR